MKRTWTCFAILLLLLPLSSSGQASLPRSITVLKSSSSTLQLPGNLALTATVAPAANAPGMPSGNVQFFTNTTSLIGTAPLTAIPSTQKFSSPPITSNQGYLPFGLFNLPSKTSKGSVVGLLDFGITDSGAYFPELTIYSGQGSSLFATSALYNMSDSNITSTYPGVDAFAVGDFNHDGSPDVLIHGYSSQTQANEYYVLPGNSDGTFNANSKISPDNSGLTCSCSNPTEMITVDDFNGDGYPDVAYAGSPYNSNGQVGVALNGGSKNPATFTTFTTAPIVPPIANSTA